jgi:hypothetical protein
VNRHRRNRRVRRHLATIQPSLSDRLQHADRYITAEQARILIPRNRVGVTVDGKLVHDP